MRRAGRAEAAEERVDLAGADGGRVVGQPRAPLVHREAARAARERARLEHEARIGVALGSAPHGARRVDVVALGRLAGVARAAARAAHEARVELALAITRPPPARALLVDACIRCCVLRSRLRRWRRCGRCGRCGGRRDARRRAGGGRVPPLGGRRLRSDGFGGPDAGEKHACVGVLRCRCGEAVAHGSTVR